MHKHLTLSVSPSIAADEQQLQEIIREELGLDEDTALQLVLKKRSIDARSKHVKVNLSLDVYIDEFPSSETSSVRYREADKNKTVYIIGAGPAGLFAALKLLEYGIRPVIFERGKDVRARRRDLAAINKEHLVNPESNYCFGEGGAGTYSDGKLYTRSNKRGDVRSVLDIFIAHGASAEIGIDAHPHIGTNKLPAIIVKMRETIQQYGGEIHFQSKLTDVHAKNNRITGIEILHLLSGQKSTYETQQLVLATGHSARDVYELFERKKIKLKAKPFALGVRIEHPQSVIDRAQYHCSTDQELMDKRRHLPPASYSLVNQSGGRGVYSFCMCPGGIIAPCATDQQEVVTNGWSPSRRNNPYANSGMVVSINDTDLIPFRSAGVLAGLRFQQSVEKQAWIAGRKTQAAPAQRLMDFLQNKNSINLPDCSYQPGIVSSSIEEVIGKNIARPLRESLKVFGSRIKSYLTNEAVLVATESRTSTPVRIPRHSETCEHLELHGLYPCGEGAGYAGGIMSAAMDGQRVAVAIASTFN